MSDFNGNKSSEESIDWLTQRINFLLKDMLRKGLLDSKMIALLVKRVDDFLIKVISAVLWDGSPDRPREAVVASMQWTAYACSISPEIYLNLF